MFTLLWLFQQNVYFLVRDLKLEMVYAESLIPEHTINYLKCVTVLNVKCRSKQIICQTLFVSVQSSSATQAEVPLAMHCNLSTGHCLNSHVGQIDPCTQLPNRLPFPMLGTNTSNFAVTQLYCNIFQMHKIVITVIGCNTMSS